MGAIEVETAVVSAVAAALVVEVDQAVVDLAAALAVAADRAVVDLLAVAALAVEAVDLLEAVVAEETLTRVLSCPA